MDERQLWIRGNAFKHGFVVICILVFLDGLYATAIQGNHIFGSMSGIVMIAFVTMFVMIELIRKKAYEWTNGGNKFMFIIMTIAYLYLLIFHGNKAIQDGLLNTIQGRESLGMCLSMLFLLIFTVYYLLDTMMHKDREEE